MTLPTITLSRAVRKNGKEVTVLTMVREPTIGDITKHGEPFVINQSADSEPTVAPNANAVLNIAADCFAVPVDEFRLLPISEYPKLLNALTPFFAPQDSPPETQTESSGLDNG